MEHINVINKEEREVYIYGTELMLSSIVGILALIIVSVCIGQCFQWLPFLMGFVPLRLLGGGYHAKNHRCCILTFTAIYVVCTILTKTIQTAKVIIAIFSIPVFFTICFFSPVEPENKVLSIAVRATNRRKSILLAVFNAIIAFLYISNIIVDHIWITTYLTGFISAGILILIVVLTRNEDQNENLL